MHLVGFFLHPLEETFHPVPSVVFPEFLSRKIGTSFTMDHKVLVRIGELFKGKMDIDVMNRAGAE